MIIRVISVDEQYMIMTSAAKITISLEYSYSAMYSVMSVDISNVGSIIVRRDVSKNKHRFEHMSIIYSYCNNTYLHHLYLNPFHQFPIGIVDIFHGHGGEWLANLPSVTRNLKISNKIHVYIQIRYLPANMYSSYVI